MKRILKNLDDLKGWEREMPEPVRKALEIPAFRHRLERQVEVLDTYYGKDRDLERDLGGYCAVLYGDEQEVSLDKERILGKYHLRSEDYELEDVYECPVNRQTVCFQLFLCSSDYGIGLMLVVDRGEEC